MDINNPIPQEWTSYVTQTAVNLEVVPSSLYDTNTYVDNVSQSLLFFNAVRATQDLGNMQIASMLPNPQSFLIQAIRLYAKYTDVVGTTVASQLWNDLILLVNTGILRFTIGEKKYGPWPLWWFSAGSFVKGMIAGANSNFMGYAQVDGPMYSVSPYLMIAPLQNFSVELAWPAAAVDLTGNMVLQVAFDGQLARAVQ